MGQAPWSYCSYRQHGPHLLAALERADSDGQLHVPGALGAPKQDGEQAACMTAHSGSAQHTRRSGWLLCSCASAAACPGTQQKVRQRRRRLSGCDLAAYVVHIA